MSFEDDEKFVHDVYLNVNLTEAQINVGRNVLKEYKQKVREAIKKARISSMTHKCPKCHELVWTTTREEVVSYIVLLRELCLDDEVKE